MSGSRFVQRRRNTGGVASALGFGGDEDAVGGKKFFKHDVPPGNPQSRLEEFTRMVSNNNGPSSARKMAREEVAARARGNSSARQVQHGKRVPPLRLPSDAYNDNQSSPAFPMVPRKPSNNAAMMADYDFVPPSPLAIQPSFPSSSVNNNDNSNSFARQVDYQNCVNMIMELKQTFAREQALRMQAQTQLQDYKQALQEETKFRKLNENRLMFVTGKLKELEMRQVMEHQMNEALAQRAAQALRGEESKMQNEAQQIKHQLSREHAVVTEQSKEIHNLAQDKFALQEQLNDVRNQLDSLKTLYSEERRLSEESAAREANITATKLSKLEKVLTEVVMTTAKHTGALEDDWLKKFVMDQTEHQQTYMDRKFADFDSSVKSLREEVDAKEHKLRESLTDRVLQMEDDLSSNRDARIESTRQTKEAIKDIVENMNNTVEVVVQKIKLDIQSARDMSEQSLVSLANTIAVVEPMVYNNNKCIGKLQETFATLEQVVRAEVRSRQKNEDKLSRDIRNLVQAESSSLNILSSEVDTKLREFKQATSDKHEDIIGKLADIQDKFSAQEELEHQDVIQLRTTVKGLRDEVGNLAVLSTKHDSAIVSAQSELTNRANQLQAKLDQTHVVIEEHRDEVHKLHNETTEKIHAMQLKQLETDSKHDLKLQTLSNNISEGLTKELGNIQTNIRDVQDHTNTQLTEAYARMAEMRKKVSEDLTALNKETEAVIKEVRRDVHEELNRMESSTRMELKDLTKTITSHHEEAIRTSQLTVKSVQANAEAVVEAREALTSQVDKTKEELQSEVHQTKEELKSEVATTRDTINSRVSELDSDLKTESSRLDTQFQEKVILLEQELTSIRAKLKVEEDDLIAVEVEQVMEGMKNALVAHSDHLEKKKNRNELRSMLSEIRELVAKERAERIAHSEDRASHDQEVHGKTAEELRAIEASLAAEQVAQAAAIKTLSAELKALQDMELGEELKELVAKEEAMLLHHEEVQTDIKQLRKLCDDNVHDLADLRSLLQAGKFANGGHIKPDDSYFEESQNEEENKVGELTTTKQEEEKEEEKETTAQPANDAKKDEANEPEEEEEQTEDTASYEEESFLSDNNAAAPSSQEEQEPQQQQQQQQQQEEEEEERPATVKLDQQQQHHDNESVPPIPREGICGQCGDAEAVTECTECSDKQQRKAQFCVTCDATVHQSFATSGHTRTVLNHNDNKQNKKEEEEEEEDESLAPTARDVCRATLGGPHEFDAASGVCKNCLEAQPQQPQPSSNAAQVTKQLCPAKVGQPHVFTNGFCEHCAVEEPHQVEYEPCPASIDGLHVDMQLVEFQMTCSACGIVPQKKNNKEAEIPPADAAVLVKEEEEEEEEEQQPRSLVETLVADMKEMVGSEEEEEEELDPAASSHAAAADVVDGADGNTTQQQQQQQQQPSEESEEGYGDASFEEF